MPRHLAGAGILALIVLLGVFMPAITAHAEVPVMNGKVLLYWTGGGYISVTYMYNDTSVVLLSVGRVWGGYSKPVILDYEPSSNKLILSGIDYTAEYLMLDNCNEHPDWILGGLLTPLPNYLGSAFFILPKSLVENMNMIASTGYVNFVQSYFDDDEGKWITESCTAPFNSTLLSISTGTYMGYPVVIVTFNSEVLGPGWQPIKAYWRTDGVLLALVNGTQPLVKLAAEDDLGLKKPGETQQPSSGAGSTQGATSSTTTSGQEGAETSTQASAGGSGMTQSSQPSSASSTSTAGQQFSQSVTQGSASSRTTTATSGLSANSVIVAVAVAAVLVAVIILVMRK